MCVCVCFITYIHCAGVESKKNEQRLKHLCWVYMCVCVVFIFTCTHTVQLWIWKKTKSCGVRAFRHGLKHLYLSRLHILTHMCIHTDLESKQAYRKLAVAMHPNKNNARISLYICAYIHTHRIGIEKSIPEACSGHASKQKHLLHILIHMCIHTHTQNWNWKKHTESLQLSCIQIKTRVTRRLRCVAVV